MLLGHHRAPHGDCGLSSVEYSLATVGVAGLLAAAVLGLGEHLAAVFDCMSRQLNGPTATCGASVPPGDPDDEGTGNDGTVDQPGPTSTQTTTSPGTPTNSPTGTPTPSPDPTPSPSTSGSTTSSPPPGSAS